MKLLLGFLATLLLAACPTRSGAASQGLAIVIRQDGGGFRYVIAGRAVEAVDILSVLATELSRVGRDGAVAVLAREEVPVGKVTQLKLILGKVGFRNVRYFYFVEDGAMMGELGMSLPAVPFTLEPWSDQRIPWSERR